MELNERFELAKKEFNGATAAWQKYTGVYLSNKPNNFSGHNLKEMSKAFDRLEHAENNFFELGRKLHSKK